MTTIEVIEPAGSIQKLAASQRNPVVPRKGRRLAILDNAKPSANGILAVVTGGEGKHSATLPSFGSTVSVTRQIPDA